MEKKLNSQSNQQNRPAVFRRFCRQGYAAFASLHREVRIGVLTVATLASVNLPKVQAASPAAVADGVAALESAPETDERELDEVAVAGTMSPLAALQSARIVNVITAQQIEASAVQTVNDLLKLAVGVDVRQRGGFGIQTDISIDGGTFDQISLLLNGVNISSPHTGHLAADFPVSLADIERIEILEGAASRVYGASAFGGAINIVTRRDPPHALPVREGAVSQANRPRFTCDAGVEGGSYATFGGDARFSVHSTPSLTGSAGGGSVVGGSLSALYQRSDGATTNSSFQRGNAYLQSYVDAPDFRVDFQAGYSQKAYGANTFYSAAYPDQYERNTRYIASLAAETKGRLRVRPEIYWHRLLDNFELIRGTTTGENFHRSDVQGVRLTADLRWAAGRTAVGGEVREEGIYSTSLGQPLRGRQKHKVPHGDVYYSRHDNRVNFSFNVEHNILLPHFTASIGVLANENTRFDSHLRFYPGVDLAYRPTAHWSLFASYNKGFRLPTFTDLYYKSPTHEGNKGMRAEESHSFQLGLQNSYSYSRFAYHLSLKGFYHRGTDLIDWVMYSADDVFHSANFNLDNMGFQASLNCQLSPANSQLPPVTCQLSYAFIHQHRRDDVAIYKSNYAMEYLRHKFVATLEHRVWSHLSASWNLRWQDRMGDYILYENGASTGRLVSYDPYATLDLKLRWRAPLSAARGTSYEIWAEGTNLTNHRYYDLGNIPQPGIVVLAGARIRF